jgi:hypothetical protein
MEHFYNNIDGYMNDRNAILFEVVLDSITKNCTWVELGSWTGKSAAYCIVELINRDKLGKFFCVDTWEGGEEHQDHEFIETKSLRDIFDNNLAPLAGKYTPIKSMSWEAASQFADNSVDFCYVDAGHTYSDVTKDLTAWYPKIRSGSYFGGDDYTKGWPEVQQAVWDFFKPMNIKVYRSGRGWIIRKP